MKIVSICAAKGGCTKSSVTASLAVRAARESRRVALFDLNGDQGDLTQWWILRGHPANPRIIEVEKISQDIEVLRAEKFDWLFIDTPTGRSRHHRERSSQVRLRHHPGSPKHVRHQRRHARGRDVPGTTQALLVLAVGRRRQDAEADRECHVGTRERRTDLRFAHQLPAIVHHGDLTRKDGGRDRSTPCRPRSTISGLR